MLIIRYVPVGRRRHAFRVSTTSDGLRSAPTTAVVGSFDDIREVFQDWLEELEEAVTPTRRGRD
jgi:hypothetical protein